MRSFGPLGSSTDTETRKDGVVKIDYTLYGYDGRRADEREAVLKAASAVDRDTGHPVSVPCRVKGPLDRYAVVAMARAVMWVL